MKRYLMFPQLCALIFLGLLSACQQKETDLLQANSMESRMKEAQFVSQSTEELFSLFENRGENEPVSFRLENGTTQAWEITAWRDGFLSKGFTATKAENPAVAVQEEIDFITLSGVLEQAPGGTVSLVLTRNMLGGSITVGEEAYHLKPVSPNDTRKASGFMLGAASAEQSGKGEPLSCLEGEPYEPTAEEISIFEKEGRSAASCSEIRIRAWGDYEYFRYKAGANLNWANFLIVLTVHEASQKFAYVGNKLALESVNVFTNTSNPFYFPTGNSLTSLWYKTWQFSYGSGSYPGRSVDASLLFTGKHSSNINNIGYSAYTGTLCRNLNSLSISVVRVTPSASRNVNNVAHQIGHLAGASDSNYQPPICRYNSLMEGIIPYNSGAYFSSCSRDEILLYRFFNHSCMSAVACD